MPYLLYTLVIYLLFVPGSMFRLLRRSIGAPHYRKRWSERLGCYHSQLPKLDGAVVFHAVSVGEVHAAQPLIDAFMLQYPSIPVVITTTTPTGSARVSALFGSRVTHVYLPWDLPGATQRFFQQFSPRLLVLMETELWPGLIRAANRHHCGLVLANARLSEKSFAGYQRFLLRSLVQNMLGSLRLVVAQAEADGQRFLRLGLPAARLQINGSLKFDVAIDQLKTAQGKAVKQTWAGRPVWIAASTRDGEDAQILQAQLLVMAQYPDALLVLVPRHPERFRQAGSLADELGLAVAFNSQSKVVEAQVQVLIGDTMGDMAFYYALADLAFVGGSLVPTGCQNIIEPAALGLPVITGPSLFNFQQASELLLESDAMRVVQDADELGETLTSLFADKEQRLLMGQAAENVVSANQGASSRLLDLLEGLMQER